MIKTLGFALDIKRNWRNTEKNAFKNKIFYLAILAGEGDEEISIFLFKFEAGFIGVLNPSGSKLLSRSSQRLAFDLTEAEDLEPGVRDLEFSEPGVTKEALIKKN